MRIIFSGQAARTAGLRQTSLALKAALTVREVLAILGNLYPGFGQLSHGPRAAELQVYLNGRPAQPDHPVSDADRLEIRTADVY